MCPNMVKILKSGSSMLSGREFPIWIPWKVSEYEVDLWDLSGRGGVASQ